MKGRVLHLETRPLFFRTGVKEIRRTRRLRRIIFAVWRFLASLARPSRTVNARRLRERGESVDSFVIRDATVDDIPALARLHVETWNATYAPLLMKVPTVEIREAQWRQAFAESGPRWFCLVVEDGAGELIGFAQADRSDGHRRCV